MLRFIKSANLRKVVSTLSLMSICLILSSCGGGLKVKEGIIVEDCVKIPKQTGVAVIREDEGEFDLIVKLAVENLKPVDKSLISTSKYVELGLLDKDGIQLIYIRENLDESLLTVKGKKEYREFSLSWGNSDKTKQELESIIQRTKSIVFNESHIMKREGDLW